MYTEVIQSQIRLNYIRMCQSCMSHKCTMWQFTWNFSENKPPEDHITVWSQQRFHWLVRKETVDFAILLVMLGQVSLPAPLPMGHLCYHSFLSCSCTLSSSLPGFWGHFPYYKFMIICRQWWWVLVWWWCLSVFCFCLVEASPKSFTQFYSQLGSLIYYCLLPFFRKSRYTSIERNTKLQGPIWERLWSFSMTHS